MRVRILNHNSYGPFFYEKTRKLYAQGTVHEVLNFYPDTEEIDLGQEYYEITFAPSEYEVVEE